jgi:hypothetical protein
MNKNRDHPSLYVSSLTSTSFAWMWGRPPAEIWDPGIGYGLKVVVKVRRIGVGVSAWI